MKTHGFHALAAPKEPFSGMKTGATRAATPRNRFQVAGGESADGPLTGEEAGAGEDHRLGSLRGPFRRHMDLSSDLFLRSAAKLALYDPGGGCEQAARLFVHRVKWMEIRHTWANTSSSSLVSRRLNTHQNQGKTMVKKPETM